MHALAELAARRIGYRWERLDCGDIECSFGADGVYRSIVASVAEFDAALTNAVISFFEEWLFPCVQATGYYDVVYHFSAQPGRPYYVLDYVTADFRPLPV